MAVFNGDLMIIKVGSTQVAELTNCELTASTNMFEVTSKESGGKKEILAGNSEWSATPEPRELVACIDVLEHIEPECLDDVLDDLRRCVLKYGIFTIHTKPAQKILPDGRNAHLIQEQPDWWKEKLNKRFTIIKELNIGNGFIVLVKKDK